MAEKRDFRHDLYTLISIINEGLQITVGSGTNEGPGIFVALYKEAFENSQFFRFSPNFSMIFFKNK